MRGYGQTKIYEFNLCSCFIDEYVLGLYVSVDNPSLVDVGQAECCLKQNAFDLFLSQPVSLLLVELEGVLGEILQSHASLPRCGVLFKVVDLDDIGMFKTFE